MIQNIYRLAGNRIIFFLWLIATGFAVLYLIFNLKVNADISGFLPQTSDHQTSLLIDQLKNGAGSRYLFLAVQSESGGDLPEASRIIASRLRESNRFAAVHNGQLIQMEQDLNLIRKFRYHLSHRNLSESFSIQGLKDGLQKYEEVFSSQTGLVFREVIPYDPGAEVLHVLGQLHQSGSMPVATKEGIWVSKDGDAAYLVVEMQTTGFSIDEAESVYRFISEISRQEGLKTEITGAGAFSVVSRKIIETDTKRIAIVSLVVIFAILIYVYRNWKAPLLISMPVMTGLLFGISAVNLIFGSVHGITLAFGATLIGESVDYPGYLLAHAQKGRSMEKTVRGLFPTLSLAALTTAFGSLSLLFSEFEGLSQLGLLAISGVLAAGFTTLFVLPGLVSDGLIQSRIDRSPISWSRLPGQRVIFSAALLIFSGSVAYIYVQRDSLWEDNLSKLNPAPVEMKEKDRQVREELSAVDMRYLAYTEGKTVEDALQRTERSIPILENLKEKSIIDGYDAITDLVPSLSMQKDRLNQLPEESQIEKNLRLAAKQSIFDPAAFQPFFEQYAELKSDPFYITPDLFSKSSFQTKVDALITTRGDTSYSIISLRNVRQPASLEDAFQKTEYLKLLDIKGLSTSIVEQYRKKTFLLSLVGLSGIFAVLLLVTRSFSESVKTLAPVLISVVIVFALIRMASGPLSIFHLVSLLLVTGIGTNYSLFFRRTGEEAEEELTNLALTVCIFSTILTFGLMAVSEAEVLKAMGLTVVTGAIVSLVISSAFSRRFR